MDEVEDNREEEGQPVMTTRTCILLGTHYPASNDFTNILRLLIVRNGYKILPERLNKI
jgi:hypothetical protein